jgi:hypothetical protein
MDRLDASPAGGDAFSAAEPVALPQQSRRRKAGVPSGGAPWPVADVRGQRRSAPGHLLEAQRRHLPVSRELAIRAELLERGGPELWDEFMDELRELHPGTPRPAGSVSVLDRLTAAYQEELARAGRAPVGGSR